jgi:uncharacterized membrane protein
LEAKLRNFIAPLVVIGALGLGGSALARDISMHKHSVDELKAICSKVGGSFSQDAKMYGCGTDCKGGPGTDCIVTCKTDESCVAQVIGARRPRTVLDALVKPKSEPRKRRRRK